MSAPSDTTRTQDAAGLHDPASAGTGTRASWPASSSRGSEMREDGAGPSASSESREEDTLLRRFADTGDPRLKEELVKRFLPLARSLALRYRGASEQLEDLVQVANLGLVKALHGFDPERGRSFIAYAAPTILGELLRDQDAQKSQNVMKAMLQMNKLEIEGLRKAASGKTSN